LGCSYGKCTELILKQTGNRVIAIDNSTECTQSTACLCGDAVQCGRLWVKNTDILSNPAQCLNIGRGLADHGGDGMVIFMDIGGNRECSSVLSVLVLLLKELNPTLIVVKCRELHAVVLRHEMVQREGGCGALSFWEFAMKLNAEKIPKLARDEMDDMNPLSVPGEKRICFAFLNRGRCKRSRCVYRHLAPTHPDAIKDREKRAKLEWTPKRTRSKMGKSVQSKVVKKGLHRNVLWIMGVLTLIVVVISLISSH